MAAQFTGKLVKVEGPARSGKTEQLLAHIASLIEGGTQPGAIALACNPSLLIADEPTTALDVTIQAQVLELIEQLKQKFNTSLLLITHDLGVVAEVCSKVAIIYAGEIVEYGTLKHIYEHPSHPYTIGLFGSIPNLNETVHRLAPIPGLMPDPTKLPAGCAFAERCSEACEACTKSAAPYVEIEPGHMVRCIKFAGKEC